MPRCYGPHGPRRGRKRPWRRRALRASVPSTPCWGSRPLIGRGGRLRAIRGIECRNYDPHGARQRPRWAPRAPKRQNRPLGGPQTECRTRVSRRRTLRRRWFPGQGWYRPSGANEPRIRHVIGPHGLVVRVEGRLFSEPAQKATPEPENTAVDRRVATRHWFDPFISCLPSPRRGK